MNIRKATDKDIDAVASLYEKIHNAEEKGEMTTGWERGVYPLRETAEAALQRNDLFVMEESGKVIGAAIINQIQVDVYDGADWEYEADPSRVMVIHTMLIDPEMKRRGYGTAFLSFYEEYALQNKCPYLRLDTNEKNLVARSLYKALGYKEIGTVPCVFNGIEGVNLVLIEKCLLSKNSNCDKR